MPTVGEMVTERWRRDLHEWIDSCEPTPVYQFPQVVLSETLRDLGIWDAEVLECECKKDDFECEAFYPVTRNWRDLGLEYGDRVRVIVLKGEE